MTRPTKSLLDPTFRYTSAAQTDLRKTFARLRREQKRADEKAQARTVVSIDRRQEKRR